MKHLLLLIILFLVTFSLCEAAVIDPDLQAVLQAGPPDQEIPVIISLADKVDINQIPIVPANNMREGKAYRRNAFAKALKDKADTTQGPLMELLQGRGGKKMKSLWITNSIAVTVPASVITELMSSPQIASIELDAVIEAPLIEPSTTGTPRWNIGKVNAPALWGAGITGDGAVVASLDTGVDVNHPDLQYRWRGGACSAPPNCPSWFDPYNNTTLPYGIPATGGSFTELDATHAHGTHTMGIMVGGAASPIDNAIGVAPGAKWISAKIFDDATGSSTIGIILSALQWVLQPAGDGANAPDVVNNSWTINSQNTCDTSLLTAISNLTAAGIEVVFAAGNMAITTPPTTSSSSFSPANNFGVFAVGATDCVGSGCTSPSNIIAPYSALGPSACSDRAGTTNFPNIVAPGSNIWSSVPTGGRFGTYQYFFGTSMAAPHVSGAAALLAGAMPDLTPAQIEEAFQNTAQPIGSSPNNTYGYGLLDVAAAYQYAFTSINGNVAQIASLPSSYNFGNVQISTPVSNAFMISNRGTADLQINSVPNGVSLSGTNVSDFAITGDTCSGQILHFLSSCTVTVQLSPPSVGPESATLSIASTQPTLALPLSASAFSVIHGATPSPPAIAWDGTNDKLHIAVRGSNGSSIWVGSSDSNGTFNNDWTQVPGGTPSAPAIAWNSTAQKLEIAVRGNTGNIFVGSANADGSGFSG